ncbi:MAG: propionyl-CoA synthetase, partial [Saprospiraceae bacterium]|nr:propionyl-CoA synthetase [Saprospiraceae bacterium]
MSPYHDLYRQSIQDPEGFWKAQAEQIPWFSFPETILSKDENDLYRWYRGGKLNTSYLALDYHVENGRGEQPALIYDSPVTNSRRSYTYRQLRDEVALVAGMLRS